MRILTLLMCLVIPACNASCGATSKQIVADNKTPALACLPAAIPRFVACAHAKDIVCGTVVFAELVACWQEHEPKPVIVPPPEATPPSSSSAAPPVVGVR